MPLLLWSCGRLLWVAWGAGADRQCMSCQRPFSSFAKSISESRSSGWKVVFRLESGLQAKSISESQNPWEVVFRLESGIGP